MRPYYQEPGITLYLGECLDVMRSMPDNSVDSIVTDPPYGISFMGKKWDYKVPSVEEWSEALRVLKPGGHLLAFGGSRTYHRVVVNIEDAGFEIRDQIMWLYGSGFPKSLDVSKAIDKAAGAEREVVGQLDPRSKFDNSDRKESNKETYIKGGITRKEIVDITAPATPEAKQWDGWGTALKPAHEPICVARKPLIGTVAENVLEHGTGGINIDGGRIKCSESDPNIRVNETVDSGESSIFGIGNGPDGKGPETKGRFPANLILDPEAGAMLDKQSGTLQSSEMKGGTVRAAQDEPGSVCYGTYGGNATDQDTPGDSGGASRFFYCAKASKADRDEGLEGMPLQEAGIKNDSGRGYSETDPYAKIMRRNNHPTVKPTALMQYLVRLVTPPGGTVLDSFMGSGSTGKGAVRENFKFIGIDNDEENLPIARARINAPAQVELI